MPVQLCEEIGHDLHRLGALSADEPARSSCIRHERAEASTEKRGAIAYGIVQLTRRFLGPLDGISRVVEYVLFLVSRQER